MLTRVAMLLALVSAWVPDALLAQTPDARRSGFETMSAATQALQRDDAQNPVMLWVADGVKRWHQVPAGRGLAAGPATGGPSAVPSPSQTQTQTQTQTPAEQPVRGMAADAARRTGGSAMSPEARSCADCHGEAERTMRGVAARYPAWDSRLGAPVNLQRRINLCRERYQSQPALGSEDDAMLALEAFLALQSRGVPIARPDDPKLAPALERGARSFSSRIGQLALSCEHCHDRLAGGRLGGSPIPQGHPTAYPVYRLQWQSAGSLARRLRGCLNGVRAELFPAMSAEMIELELFLAARAAGMPHEGPGVRP